MKICLVLVCIATVIPAQPQFDFLNSGRPLLDAHNCYPEDGKWSDRIDRALSIGTRMGIEQDLAWFVDPSTHQGRIVLSHTSKPTGLEPTLESYFFERVPPMVEEALRKDNRDQWPLLVLHFDFKSNEAPLLQAVWEVLGKYESWITTAPKAADQNAVQPFTAAPPLGRTERSHAQYE